MSLRKAVASGLSWSFVSLVAARVAALVTQVFLGLLLTPLEWGIYAGAVSIAALATTMRDGGVAEVIAGRDPSQFRGIYGGAFATALLVNLALACLMVTASALLADRLGGEDVVTISAILATTLILQTPSAILRGLMRSQLRFRPLTLVSTTAALLRATATVGCAFAGFGPLSFVAGLPVIAVLEVTLLWRFTRFPPTGSSTIREKWRVVAGSGAWLMIAAVGTGLTLYGDYLALGIFLLPTALGLYYFAFQLVAQTATMLIAALEPVLVPALSKLPDKERLSSAVGRSARLMVLGLGSVSTLLGLNIDYIEALLWGGQWSDATGAVKALAACFALRGTVPISRSLLISQRRYRESALQAWIVGIGLVLTAFAAGLAGLSATQSAAAVSLYLGASSLAVLVFAVRSIGSPGRAVASSVLIAWFLTAAPGAIVLVGDQLLLAQLNNLARIALVSTGYTFATLSAIRVTSPSDLIYVGELFRPLRRPIALFLRLE